MCIRDSCKACELWAECCKAPRIGMHVPHPNSRQKFLRAKRVEPALTPACRSNLHRGLHWRAGGYGRKGGKAVPYADKGVKMPRYFLDGLRACWVVHYCESVAGHRRLRWRNGVEAGTTPYCALRDPRRALHGFHWTYYECLMHVASRSKGRQPPIQCRVEQ